MPERNENQHDENDPAVLIDSESIHTTAIGIIGGTAQVDVTLPPTDEDDFDDADVVDGEVFDDQLSTGDIPLGALSAAGNEQDAATDAAADGDASSDVDVPNEIGSPEDTDASDDTDALGDTDAAENAAAVDIDAAAGEPADEHETDDDVITATVDDDGTEDSSEVPTDEVAEASDEVDAAAVVPRTGEIVTVEDRAEAAPVDDERAAAASSTRAPVAETVVATVVPTTTVITGSVPTTRREAHQAAEQVRHATERVQVVRPTEPVLQSRRIGDLEPGRESSDLLTAERLLDPSQVVRAEPEGRWQRLVYAASGRRINLGDSKRARARKELDRRITAPLVGGAKFVPVLSRKGGVGKTTVTTLLGMALADARDDRVIAIDANPDRGTLADRIGRTSGKTVRDLVRTSGDVVGFNDLSSIVARDETRLDVLASDTDPHVSEAFSDHDYENVAAIAAHYYSIVLTDTGTGIVHSVMGATLGLSDQIVVVAGMSVDEARLASETLTWLESNGFGEAVKSAVVVLNTSRPGTPMVRADELETHFSSRVRAVVRVPYDPHLAAGSAVTFRDLDPATREAARTLAASVVEGLRRNASVA
ncbi:MinD/ParA family ATP-binding protein [Microbacterium thalli]|uniref:MinD/ParA family ATP-binding protein n=1 Tax=Microbacterium thalli TaxID=3027921 RepID=UPI002365CC15|nr:MinD/ParA family protein [Microbacterium thalli]MDD7930240.1 MinD/ParA family protein [Microbacterium thalli]